MCFAIFWVSNGDLLLHTFKSFGLMSTVVSIAITTLPNSKCFTFYLSLVKLINLKHRTGLSYFFSALKFVCCQWVQLLSNFTRKDLLRRFSQFQNVLTIIKLIIKAKERYFPVHCKDTCIIKIENPLLSEQWKSLRRQKYANYRNHNPVLFSSNVTFMLRWSRVGAYTRDTTDVGQDQLFVPEQLTQTPHPIPGWFYWGFVLLRLKLCVIFVLYRCLFFVVFYFCYVMSVWFRFMSSLNIPWYLSSLLSWL